MSKYTPGPWKRRGNTVSGPFGVTVVHCMDNGVWGEKGCHSITKTEANANARLIAAAPELLEALEALLSADLYADGEGIHFIKNADTADGERAVQMARAAIAKATGGDV